MNKACPVCEAHIVQGQPLTWNLALNGNAFTLTIDVCPVDYFLCERFPTLKRALLHSEVATEMMRRADIG